MSQSLHLNSKRWPEGVHSRHDTHSESRGLKRGSSRILALSSFCWFAENADRILILWQRVHLTLRGVSHCLDIGVEMACDMWTRLTCLARSRVCEDC